MTKKTAIITGASRGIGKACAIALAKQYSHIAITAYQNKNQLEEVKQALQYSGCECISFIGDIGDYHFVASIIENIIHTWGQIDLLVNNAGISYIGLLTDMDVDEWNQIISTNLTSLFNTCHHTVPHMLSKKQGSIINISSIWGEIGASCEVAYSATKGGVNAFTKALAKELAPSQITVNAICCGIIDTDMNTNLSSHDIENICLEISIGRMGTVEEVAQMVVQLANAPSYLTGQCISLDGGWV